MSQQYEETERPGGLPGAVLATTYVVVLLVTLVVGAGVLMANVMSCDSGGDDCADRVMIATLTWAAISFLIPIAALVWGLASSRKTSTGRRNRWVALALIILLPVIGFAVNLAILFL